MPYYAVVNGHNKGIYNNWPDCKDQVHGYRSAIFRKFHTLLEAQQYCSEYFEVEGYNASDSDVSVDYGSRIIIYTDGATLRNGSDNASSGVGIYYGDNDDRNSSIVLPRYINGIRTTNQRAELLAIKHALKQIGDNSYIREYTIRTDSLYAINCITVWVKKWERNGYTNVNNEPVHNQDLIKECVSLLKDLEDDVKFEHVRGHQGEKGNEEADRLAKEAARFAAFLQ